MHEEPSKKREGKHYLKKVEAEMGDIEVRPVDMVLGAHTESLEIIKVFAAKTM